MYSYLRYLIITTLVILVISAPCFAFDEDNHEQINGTALHFRVRGTDKSNPYLLLIPDGPGGSIAPYFTWGASLEQSLNVVYLDPRGGGESQHYPIADLNNPTSSEIVGLTMANLVADIDAVRTAIGVKQWYVLGHGFGAMVGLEYASAHPKDVLGLIVMNGELYGSAVKKMLAVSDFAPETSVALERNDRIYERDDRLLLGEAQFPAQFIVGGNDQSLTLREANKESRAAPDSDFCFFQNAGHCPLVGQDSIAVSTDILRFCASAKLESTDGMDRAAIVARIGQIDSQDSATNKTAVIADFKSHWKWRGNRYQA